MQTRPLLIPFVLQGVAMAVDELCFHRRRGLPRWERIGHPLDTLTVLACFSLPVLAAPTSSNVTAYAVLAALSCAFVTKDEVVHARLCTPGEIWLHAVLFLLHPVCLIAAAVLWTEGAEPSFLAAEAGVLLAAAIYQAVYWNCLRGPT